MLAKTIFAGIALLFVAGAAAAQEEETGCTEGDEGCAPDCPTDLHGMALHDTPGIFMSWTLNSNTDVNVYRAVEDGEFVFLERLEFPATRYIDHNTEAGVTYHYQVTAIGETESEACETLTVTAIPELGSMVAMGAAAALGVGAYAFSRRP